MRDRRRAYKHLEALCVALLFLLIAGISLSNSGGTDKTVDELAAPVLRVLDTSGMTRRTPSEAAGVFGFDRSKEEGAVYYSNDNVMDVTELLIVKLCDRSDAAAFASAIEERVENQKNLYQNYAPEQYSLLENSVIEVSGNTVFYCTAKNADEVYETFKRAL